MPKETISPAIIKSYLDEYISGQEDLKDVLSLIGYNHALKFLVTDEIQGRYAKLPNLIPLIVGPAGTGKTTAVETLANALNVPFYKIDAGTIDAPHRENYDVSRILADIGSSIDCHPIIFVDEFDKLFKYVEGRDNNSGYFNSLISSFLPLLDSSYEPISLRYGKTFDKNKALIILAGAYEYVYDAKYNLQKPIGYSADIFKKHVDYTITKEDLKTFTCMTPEILSRIDTVVATKPLTKKDYYNILYQCDGGLLRHFESLYIYSGRPLKISKYKINQIIETCNKSKFGARLLKSCIFEYVKKDLSKSGSHTYSYDDSNEQ